MLQPLVDAFLKQGAIREVKDQPCFLSSIFAVPKSNGEFRMILNLARLNKFIQTPKFKLVSTATLRKLLPQGAWMAKIDLQDAYIHVPAHPRF